MEPTKENESTPTPNPQEPQKPEVSREGDFANGRGDVRGARGAESSADIIMSGN